MSRSQPYRSMSRLRAWSIAAAVAVWCAVAPIAWGAPSVSLPLASAARVPADRITYLAPPDATATVLVKREGGSDVAAAPQGVLLDGHAVATIREKEFFSLAVAPGRHTIGIRDAGTSLEPTTLGIGANAYGSYYFRISQTPNGALVFQLSSGADD